MNVAWLLFSFVVIASLQESNSLRLEPLESPNVEFTPFQLPVLPEVNPSLSNSETLTDTTTTAATDPVEERPVDILGDELIEKAGVASKLKAQNKVNLGSTSRSKLMKELHDLIDKFRLKKKRDEQTPPAPAPPAPAPTTTTASTTAASSLPIGSSQLPGGSSLPYAPLFPSSNLANVLPPLTSLFPSNSILPDVSALLKTGQSPAFQDPLQLSLGSNSFLPSLGSASLPPSPFNEGRRAQLIQMIKLRSDRIATLQQYVEQGQGALLKQNREFNEWLQAERQKGDMQIAMQKTSLQKLEAELDSLVKSQQSDVTELNNYNTQVKKAYIDSGLQLQQNRLQRAQADEAKIKDEYDKTTKYRKDIESQVAQLNKELQGLGSGASTTATTTATTTAAPTTAP